MEPWGTPALTGYLWKLPIQNHSQLSITEERKNQAKYLTWKSVRLKFVGPTCQSLSKGLNMSSVTASEARGLLNVVFAKTVFFAIR